MEALYGLLFLLAGLGVLLYGIYGLGRGLESVASNKIRRNINRLSKNRYAGFLSGIGSTILVQTSSVSMVTYIGLINIGALTLIQALPMFLGANIGGAFVLLVFCLESFNIIEFFGLFALIGAFIILFAKDQKLIKVGKILTCFGFLFCGMKMMSIGMETVTAEPSIAKAIGSMTNPLALVFIGIVLGMFLHSIGTSALMVSLMTLGDSTMTLLSAFYVMAGANLGTTFVSIVACLKSNLTAKRATFYNVYVSIITTLILVILLACTPFADFALRVLGNPTFAMIMSIIVINGVNVVIQLFLVKPACKILCKILPEKSKDKKQMVFVLDQNLYSNLPIASHQILNGMQELADEQTELFKMVESYFVEPTKLKRAEIIEKINIFTTNITQTKSNIVRISTNEESRYIARLQYYQNVLVESERIADGCLTIINKIDEEKFCSVNCKDCILEYFKLIENINKAHRQVYDIKEKEVLNNEDIEIVDDFAYDKELAELRVETKKVLYNYLEKSAKTANEKKKKLEVFDNVFIIVQTLENIANNINNQILKVY